MNESLIILGSGFVTAVLLILLTNEVTNLSLPKEQVKEESFSATSLLKGAMFVSGGILLTELLASMQQMFHLLPETLNAQDYTLDGLKYYGIFFGATLVSLLILIYSSALLYAVTSGGDNIFKQATKGKTEQVLLYFVILITLSLGVKLGLGEFMNTFLPYQQPVIY